MSPSKRSISDEDFLAGRLYSGPVLLTGQGGYEIDSSACLHLESLRPLLESGMLSKLDSLVLVSGD